VERTHGCRVRCEGLGGELPGDDDADDRDADEPGHTCDRVVDGGRDSRVGLIRVGEDVAVSGATVIASPSEKTRRAGSRSAK